MTEIVDPEQHRDWNWWYLLLLIPFVAVLWVPPAAKPVKTSPEFYELRLYHLRRGPKTKLFDDFFRDASLPAFRHSVEVAAESLYEAVARAVKESRRHAGPMPQSLVL